MLSSKLYKMSEQKDRYFKCLESAALTGDLEKLERLTRKGIYEPNPYYYWILKDTISCGQTEAAKMLIKRGCILTENGYLTIAEMNYTSSYNNTLLHLAIVTESLDLVHLLLKKNVSARILDLDGIPPLFKVVNCSFDDLKLSQFLDCLLKNGAEIKDTCKHKAFTILHYAAEKGNAKIIPLLIEKECDINAKSKDGSTALHIAAKNRHSDVVKVLLNHGADGNLFNNDNMTPFCLAIQNGDFNTYKVFLEFYFQTSNTQLSQRVDNKVLVYLATSVENVELVKLLLSNGAAVNSHSLKTGQSALHLSVENGNLEIVNELLKYEPDFQEVDSEGFIPLHVACAKGNFDIISALLDTNKYELNTKSNAGLTAFHFAAKAGHAEIVTLLLERGADFKALDHNNRTPLSFAIESTNGDGKTLEVLLTKIQNVESASLLTPNDQVLIEYHSRARKDETGNSPLHIAVQKEDETTIVLLLKHQTCIDALNNIRLTPLDLATINGSLLIVNIFLQSRDDPQSLFIPKEDGYTPMHLAVENRNTDMLELFFKAGISADISKPNRLSPLHLAVQKNDKTLVMLLLKNGAKVNVSGITELETPLFLAAGNGNAEILEILLNACTNVSSEWREGYLLMYIAAYNGLENVVKMLLDKRVDPNANLDKYLTPLHAAAQNGNENIVQLLLERGAEVNPKRLNVGHFFSSPLLAASRAGHSRIVNLLLEHGADYNAKLRSTFGICFEGVFVTLRDSMKWSYRNRMHLWKDDDDPDKSFKEYYRDVLHYRTQYMTYYRNYFSENEHVLKYEKPVSELEQILIQGSYKDSEIGMGGSLLGYTSLHFAVEAQDETSVKLLINCGANVNSRTISEKAAIDLALKKENKAIIKYLLSSGVKPKYMMMTEETFYKNYFSGNSYIMELAITIENEFEDYVQMLLETRADEFIEHKEPLLHVAIMKRNAAIVKMLLKHKTDININHERYGPALSLAMACNETDIIKLLLDAGAKLDIDYCFTNCNPFSVAIDNKDITHVDMMLWKNESKFNFKFFPLKEAISNTNITIFEMLLKKGLNDSDFLTLFCQAVRLGNPQVVQKFIDAGALIKMEYAKKKILIDPTGIDTEHDVNSIQIEKTIQVLLDYGADVYVKLKDVSRLEMTYKLYMQIYRISVDLTTFLLNGVNPNHQIKQDKTLLKLAIECRHSRTVKVLMINGADVDSFSEKNKDVPLKVAIDQALKGLTEYRPCLDEALISDGELSKSDREVLSGSVIKKYGSIPSRYIVRLLIQEVAKRLANNQKISEGTLTCINSEHVKKYYEWCQQEIKLSKVTKICEGISYFDVLRSNYSELVSMCRYKHVRLILSRWIEVTELFPEYAEVLIGRIEIASERRHLLDSSYHLLQKVLRYQFPFLIVDHIYSFLPNQDLRNLNRAFNINMFLEDF